MSAQHTAHQLDGLTTGILMACMISAERGADAARARQQQRQDIMAHNAQVASMRADRRRRAAATAAQAAVGEARMARWIDRAAR